MADKFCKRDCGYKSDFAQWYTDVILKSFGGLRPGKGTMVIWPLQLR